MLVVIDVVVCGIDIDDVLYVVNFDLLNELESYVYWIGWMGRVGSEGVVVFFCIVVEWSLLSNIEWFFGCFLSCIN